MFVVEFDFDSEHIYGNEAEIGEALQKCFKEGVVKREEIKYSYPFPPTAFSFFWGSFSAYGALKCTLTLKLFPEVISTILSRYITLTVPTN